MKKNNKGFTLIEMLGVVILLGILGTIAVAGTSKYLEQSRKKSFLLMSQSIYEAAQNCQTQGKCSTGTYYADTTNTNNNLIKMGYLEELKNPKSSQPNCTASVQITEIGTSDTEYKKYNYSVSLKCPGMYNSNIKTYNWPEQKNK